MTAQNTLDSVFSTESKNFHYVKLHEESGLYQYHARFWGHRIEDSARSWFDSLSTDSRIQLGLQSLWQNENVDADYNSASSLPPDEEDDLCEGCHVLDLRVKQPYVWPEQIWVRADYIRMYDACEQWFQSREANRIIITGQPGIGKTLGLRYAVCRRAGERKPFVWDQGGVSYLFVEEGVFQILDHPWSSLKQNLMIFVDSDPPNSVNRYIGHLAPMFVVYTSPPEPARWKSLEKTGRSLTFVMQPWFRRELRRSARLRLFPDVDENEAMDIVQRLGPIPRLIEHLQLDRCTWSLSYAIGLLSDMDIKSLIVDALALFMDKPISDKILLLGRSEHQDVASDSTVSIISDRISTALALRLRSVEKSQQVQLYKRLCGDPSTSQAAGFIYGANIMEQLSAGLTLDLLPIIKPPRPSSEHPNSRPQWQSPLDPDLDLTLEPLRSRSQNTQKQLTLSHLEIEEFTSELPVAHNTLYIPAISNQHAQEPFLVLDNHLYFVQMTSAANHHIDNKLLDFAKRVGFKADDCRFIFITPNDSRLTVPCPSNPVLRRMDVFVAALDVSV